MVSPESASGEVPSLQISELGSATQVDLYPQDSLSTDKRPSMSPLKTVGSPKIGSALTYEHSQYGTPALNATVEDSLRGTFQGLNRTDSSVDGSAKNNQTVEFVVAILAKTPPLWVKATYLLLVAGAEILGWCDVHRRILQAAAICAVYVVAMVFGLTYCFGGIQ